MSLQNRIADLEKNSCNWKTRVDKPTPTVSSLSTVKTQLTTSQSTWKGRIGEKDAHLFTVKGKLARDEVTVTQTISPTHPPLQSQVQDDPSSSSDEETLSLEHCYNPNDNQFSSFFSTTTSTTTTIKTSIKEEEEVNLDLDLDLNQVTITKPDLSTRLLLSSRPRKPLPKQVKLKKTSSEKVSLALASKSDYKIALQPPKIVRQMVKHLYKIKGRRSPIPLEIDLKIENLTNHDCFVLLTEKSLFCFYGEYANLLEKLRCDEFFNHYRKLRNCVKVTYKGQGWTKFVKEFPYEDGDISEELIGDEGDAIYENGLKFKFYDWDGVQWVRRGKGLKWADLMTGVPPLFLLDYGTELYFYISKNCNDISLAERTIHEVLDVGKYLNFQKVKKNLEPIQFWAKFPGRTQSGRKEKVNMEEGDLSGKGRMDRVRVEIEQVRDVLTLEGAEFSAGRVRVMEEDPRGISYKTFTLEKYLVTISSIVPSTSLLEFCSSSCYLIHHTYALTYTTNKLNKSASTTSSGRQRSTYYLWYGQKCSPLDRGRLSTLFSLTPDFLAVFPGKDPAGEKVALEEGLEPVFFYELFCGGIFSRCGSGIYEKRGTDLIQHFVEVDDYLEGNQYFEWMTGGDLGLTSVTCRPTNQISKVYRIFYKSDVVRVEELLDYPLVQLIPLQNYLVIGSGFNCLVLETSDLESRRIILAHVTPLCFEDYFVTFSLEDYFAERFTYLGSFCRRFLTKVEEIQGFFLRGEMDFNLFKEFFSLEGVGDFLSGDVLEDKLGMNRKEFQLLPKWRRKILTREFL